MKIRVRPVSAPVWPAQPGGETYSEMKFDLTGQRKSGSNGRRGLYALRGKCYTPHWNVE
jgi:hypothetical protein